MKVCKCRLTDWSWKPGLLSRTGSVAPHSDVPTAQPACQVAEHAGYQTASCSQTSLYYRWIDYHYHPGSLLGHLANYLCQRFPVTMAKTNTNTNLTVQTPHEQQPVGVKVQGVLHEETHRLCLSCESVLCSLWRYLSSAGLAKEGLQEDELVLPAALRFTVPALSSPRCGNDWIASVTLTEKKLRFKGKDQDHYFGQ